MSQNVHGTVLKFPPSLPPTTRVFLAQIFGNVVLTCVFCTRGVRTHACGHDAAGGYFLKKKRYSRCRRYTVPDVVRRRIVRSRRILLF